MTTHFALRTSLRSASFHDYRLPWVFARAALAVLSLLIALPLGLTSRAAAESAKSNSASSAVASKDTDKNTRKDKDRPDLRDRWMMRGRTAPAGQSAAELRLRAHRQKMAMRAAAAKRAATYGDRGASGDPASSALQFALSPALAKPADSSTAWVPLGPAPLISDGNLYGAVSGRVTAVAIDPSDSSGNTVYAASASGGVWQSTNAANATAANVSWTALTDQQASLVNGAVSVKSDGSVVLVGTGEPDSALDSYYGVGILRSTNQGSSWTLIPAATGSNPALSFSGLGFAKFAWSTSPATTVVGATATTTLGFDEGAITSSTSRGLYSSSDSGQTWTFQTPQDAGKPISPASASATDVIYDATAGQFIAAIRYHGLYTSTNGTTWTRMANQPAPLTAANCPTAVSTACPIYRGQLAVVAGRDEVYFWFISLDSSGDVIDEGIWKSLKGGPWAQIDETGITNCGDAGDLGCGVDRGYYNLEIAALPDGQATDLYAGAVNLFKCELLGGSQTCTTLDTNFPKQWINLTHVYGCSSIAGVHPDEHGLDSILIGNPPSQVIMYFANDGGIYRTLDGYTDLVSGTCGTPNTFDNLNASSAANGTIGSLTQFVSFSLDTTDENTILGGTQDNGSAGTSTATTSTQWITVNGGDGGYNAIDPAALAQWYTANPYVNIYTCSSGIACTTDAFSLTVGSEEVGGDEGAYYVPYILDPQNPSEMLVGTCRVWRGAPTVPPSALTSISVDFETLGEGTCTGDETNLVRALVAGGPAVSSLSTVVYATTDGTGPNAAAPTGGEVWVTTNAGTAPMTNITGAINPSNYTISSVALDSSDPTGLTAYVGIMGFGVSHVFQTTNAGASWSDWSGSGSAALPDAPVNALLVDTKVTPTQIYAATDVGVFVSSTASPGWIEVGTPSVPDGSAGYLPNVPATAVGLFDSGGVKKLRVSTYGRGVWEYALPTGPDYTNIISNSPQTIYPAQTATFNGTLTAYNGYSSPVNLSCAGVFPATCLLSSPQNPTPQSTIQLTPTPSGAPYMLTASGVVGDYTFAAHAVGTDSNSTTRDEPVTLHIVGFSLSTPNPNALTVAQGGTSNSSNFQVAAEGSFSGTVNLGCSGLPAGATPQFSVNGENLAPSNAVTISPGNSPTVTMTVAASPNTPTGGSTVTLDGTVAGAPALPNPPTFTLTVTPGFSPPAVTATPGTTVVGQNVTWNGTLTAGSSYSGTVNLSCVGAAPACSFSPSSLSPSVAGTPFTVTVGSASVGTFNFSIQASDGSLTLQQNVSLNVGTDVTWTDTGNSSVTVLAGQPAIYQFLATPLGSATFTGAVNFACANLPALTSCSFNPASLAAGAGKTPIALTITTAGPNQAAQVQRGDSLPRASHSAAGGKPQAANSNSKDGKSIPFGLIWLSAIPIAGIILAGTARVKLSRASRIVVCLFALCWLAALVACGALGSGGNGTVVTIIPASSQIALGEQQNFSATVVNASSSSVTWSINPVSGSIITTGTSTAQYSAPGIMPASSTVTVTATSQSNPTASGSATITLSGPSVTVTVAPTVATLYANETGNSWPASATQEQFSATVNNGNSQTVIWAVTGSGTNGTIDSTGLYTAPTTVPNPATFTVTATSTLATSSASAAVTIQAPMALGTYSNIQATATAAAGPAYPLPLSLTVN